ncbi:hypothetical protein COU37_00670 [Candidatus Micrarchaeota archaeon CG10_big_fil_rev_8_21_14_0_10_45_29]|nr:MAG: hypothetical protein COU37_00670 [Candidatus Micrarchaeota archaeon CG10_big_fil_rev_8_21_14_0_10_45_29]
MNVFLCKYHVLRCPKCGHVKTGTARSKTCCPSCAHSWEISKGGHTFGVLKSFWTPAEASAFAQQFKMQREQARAKAIGEELEVKTAFNMLGLSQGCSREDFVKEYRKRALMHHPDTNEENPAAQENFKQITNAAQQIRSAMGWQ